MSKKKTRHLLAVRSIDQNAIMVVNTETNKVCWAQTAREAIAILERPETEVNFNGCEAESYVHDWATNPTEHRFVKVCL